MGNSFHSELKRHYETAEKTGVLNVSKSKMSELSPELLRLSNHLRTLELSHNKLTSLKGIGNLVNLKTLSVDHNNLSALSDEVGKLLKLEVLTASHNGICELPSTLSNLTNLKKVELQANSITEFPTMLCNLKHLDLLDLSDNKIRSIPGEVEALYVTELNLNHNQICSIAEEIADCPRLKTLRIQENCLKLSDIPPKILAHSNISNISAEGNLFAMKDFMNLDGYDEYMERYTSVKKKLY